MSISMNMLPCCCRQPFSFADLPATSSLLLDGLLVEAELDGVWSVAWAPMSLLGLDVLLVGGVGFWGAVPACASIAALNANVVRVVRKILFTRILLEGSRILGRLGDHLRRCR